MHETGHWVEIKHDDLFFEAEALVGLGKNKFNVLVHGLLHVNVAAGDLVGVLAYIGKGLGPFPQFEPRPPSLDAVSSPFSYDLRDYQRIVSQLLPVNTHPRSLLEFDDCCNFIE